LVTAIRKETSETVRGTGNTGSLKDLYDILLKEIQTTLLQSVPMDTYQNIATLLGTLKSQRYEGIELTVRDRMIDIISISAKLLLDTRHHKILEEWEQSSQNLSAPSTTISGIDYSKLTDEEKYILDEEKEADKRKFAILAATLNGRPKVLESISGRVHSRQIVVRFIRPMDQFIGTNMTKYGPFQEEDVAVLPFENARSLIENGKALEVDFLF
jgi:DNA replication factor GINS